MSDRIVIIVLAVVVAWLAAALVVWAWVRAATRPVPASRYVEPDDGVQGFDPRTFGLSESATNAQSVTVRLDGQTYTYTSGGLSTNGGASARVGGVDRAG